MIIPNPCLFTVDAKKPSTSCTYNYGSLCIYAALSAKSNKDFVFILPNYITMHLFSSFFVASKNSHYMKEMFETHA